MTVRSSSEAMAVMRLQHHNTPGWCQANVNHWYNAPPVGDVDHDGDADAVDGWESEPKEYRHPGDRTPPDGVPLSFHGGRLGYGHRAISMVRGVGSTDMNGHFYSAGTTSVVPGTLPEAIAIIEQQMGVEYTGWSETIGGNLLPNFQQHDRPAPKPQTRGWRVDRSLRRLRKAYAKAVHDKKTARAKLLKAAIQSLLAIPTHARPDPKKH